MSTYTSSLGLEKITPGSQAGLWGNTTNNTYDLIDQAITGVTPISFASASGSTYTLTDDNGAANEARAAVLNISGTASGPNTVVVPNKQKTYLVRNGTSQPITFQTASPGQVHVVDAGYNTLIFCDNNNNVYPGILVPGASTLAVSGGGTGKTTFATAGFLKTPGGTGDFTSSATVNAATEISGVLPVANGGTGQSTLASGALLVGSGTGAVGGITPVGYNTYVLTSNGSSWYPAPPPSASGVSSIAAGTGISATPATGAVTITNTGVTSLSAGTGISLSATTGGITVTNTGPALNTTNAWTNTNSYTVASTWSSGGYTTTVSSNGISYGNSNNAISGDNTGTQLAFAVGGTSRMSIYSSYIQTAIPVYAYSGTFGTTGNPYGSAIYAYSNSGGTPIVTYANNSGTNNAIAFFNPSGSAGYISTSGTTTNYGTSSDYRLKDNVTPLQNALDVIGQLNPVSFTWKANGEQATGFIAHEVQKIVPQAVVGEKDAVDEDGNPIYQNIDTSTLVGILTAAIKELKAEIDVLKAAK